jgi:hypothetical protein
MKKSCTENAEFAKFIFFQRKSEERDNLIKYVGLLASYGKISVTQMRKAMCISSYRWERYFRGDVPLPAGFITKFEEKFKEELRKAKRAAEDACYNVLDSLIVKTPKHLSVTLTPLGGPGAEDTAIIDPEKSATI